MEKDSLGFLPRTKSFLRIHGLEEEFPESPQGVKTWCVRLVPCTNEPSKLRWEGWNDAKEGMDTIGRVSKSCIETPRRKRKLTDAKFETCYLLRVFVEDVSLSRRLHCDACRMAGWSHHPVCSKRIHFVVGIEEKGSCHPIARTRKLCTACGRTIPAPSRTCPLCKSDTRAHEYLQCTSHLLHGMVHGNGYGHLLRINGRQGGSVVLSGHQLMMLWDDLCRAVGMRRISVEDVSNWYGMEFRLLRLAAHRTTWYGKFGYKWGRGSYGVTEDVWLRCAKVVHDYSLEQVIFDLKSLGRRSLKAANALAWLQDVTGADTIGELLRSLMDALQRAVSFECAGGHLEETPLGKMSGASGCLPKLHASWTDSEITSLWNLEKAQGGTTPPHVQLASNIGKTTRPIKLISSERKKVARPGEQRASSCRWTPARISKAQEAVIEVLKSFKSGSLSRQYLRDLTRTRIGDTGLLDYVLKTIGGSTIGKYRVDRIMNLRTGVLQYSLARLSNKEGLENAAMKQSAQGTESSKLALNKKDKRRRRIFPAPSMAPTAQKSKEKSTSLLSGSKSVLDAILLVYQKVLMEYEPLGPQRNLRKTLSRQKDFSFRMCCQVLLDTKHFVKLYHGCEVDRVRGDHIRIHCIAHLQDAPPSLRSPAKRGRRPPAPQPPPETVTLSPKETFGDLKRKAQIAFASIYPIFKAWRVESIDGLGHVADRTCVSGVLQHGTTIILRGSGLPEASDWRFETGLDHWVVRCLCGTNDDDGEPMLECERCGTWLHTRCLGIKDAEAIPDGFLCPTCACKDHSDGA